MDIKKINFKQPKYMIPAIIYIPLLFTGYFLIDTFNVETSGSGNSKPRRSASSKRCKSE